MSKTSIQWAPGCGDGRQGHTINPFRARRTIHNGQAESLVAIGHFCVKISPGCKKCYASRIQSRLQMLPFLAVNRDKVELFLDADKLQDVIRRKKPTGFFWFDMTDAFLDDYPDEWLDASFAAMALTQQHIHMVLTKRPYRALQYMHRLAKSIDYMEKQARGVLGCTLKFAGMSGEQFGLVPWPLPNVRIGVSVENADYKWRIDVLREIPAASRFLSIEPLIDDVGELDLRGINWVIVGGESGHGASPMNLRWARDIQKQCRSANVPFFMKQYGANPRYDHHLTINEPIILKDGHGGDIDEWHVEDRVREWPTI